MAASVDEGIVVMRKLNYCGSLCRETNKKNATEYNSHLLHNLKHFQLVIREVLW